MQNSLAWSLTLLYLLISSIDKGAPSLSQSTSSEIRYIGAACQPNMVRSREALLPIIEQAGLEFIGIERAQEGRRTTLWVYLDHPDGITLDQCGEVSPEISAVLDLVDPITEAYDLRVSSPGIERPLMSDRDFQKFIGSKVRIRLMSPLRGRRKFMGEILEMSDALRLKCTDGEHDVPLSLIQRAHLYYTDAEIKALLR